MELEVSWSGDVHGPDRGLLCAKGAIHPTRPAPKLTRIEGGVKSAVSRGQALVKGVPVSGAYHLIEARLLKGQATIDELQASIGCHRNTIMKLLARLRRSGQLRSTLRQPDRGRGAREQSHWIEG